MIAVIQRDVEYEVKFSYDPSIILHIKNVPGRRWHPELKLWTIPKDKLGFFLNEFKGTCYESQIQIISQESIGVNQTLDVTVTIPDIDISQVPYYVKAGARPFKHQIDFMKFALYRQLHGNMHGFLIADEQGTAKTNEAMNLAIYNQKQYGYKHCLVICCINTSKYNWVADISEHTNFAEVPYILGTRLKRNGDIKPEMTSENKLNDLQTGHMYGDINAPELPYFIITNVEVFRGDAGAVFTKQLVKSIKSGFISMIVIDEIHKNLSHTSTQGKRVLKVKRDTGSSAMWLPMTGTPIVNKPLDLFLPLKLIDAHTYKSYYTWANDFAIFDGYGHDVISYKNMPRLKYMLQPNMIRRLKKDVLDLPDKLYYAEYVENTPYQVKLYNKIAGELRHEKERITQALNPLAQFIRLRQVSGSPELVDDSIGIDSSYMRKNAKLQRLLQLLEEIHSRGEKVLIFSNWVEPLRTLYRFVSVKYKTCCFTGTMSEKDRQHHKQVFMTNPEYTVMMGTIAAMGTTHTLTAATNVIFYDEPWTPSDKVQAEDRAHRIGTDAPSVNIYTLISKGTVDEKVHNILYTKQGISNFIIDNLDIRKDPELFDLLLGDTSQLTRRIHT